MAKAILVLDEMPVDCENCQLSYRNAYAGITCPALLKPVGDTWASVANGERYELCPLKALPKREPDDQIEQEKLAEKEHLPVDWTQAFCIGWNACLNVIEGKED